MDIHVKQRAARAKPFFVVRLRGFALALLLAVPAMGLAVGTAAAQILETTRMCELVANECRILRPVWAPGYHVEDREVNYKLHTPSLTATQRAMIDLMGDEWNRHSAMSVVHSSNTTSYDSETSGTRLIWEDELPGDAAWDGCRGTAWVACTKVERIPSDPDHLGDLDTVLNEDFDWFDFETEARCAAGIRADNQPVQSDDRDQRGVMLHEFGHWQYLADDGAPQGTIMRRNYADHRCRWTVDPYSEYAVATLYDHPSGS